MLSYPPSRMPFNVLHADWRLSFGTHFILSELKIMKYHFRIPLSTVHYVYSDNQIEKKGTRPHYSTISPD